MKIFRNWTLKWWEVGILEIALIALGIVFGLYFRDLLEGGSAVFIVVAVMGLLYFIVFRIKEVFQEN